MSEVSKEPIDRIINKLEKLSQEPAFNKKLALDMAKANNEAEGDDLADSQFALLEQEIITQKKIAPEDKKALETAKKHYFLQLALSFFEEDNALRSEKAQKLEEETGKIFNFCPNPRTRVVHLMRSLYRSPEQAKALLLAEDSKTLMQTALAFYLDSWSRHFHEDEEYARYFQGEDDYFIGSYLPIVNNQLLIPEVYLNAQAVSYDLRTDKVTRRFIPSHIPGFKLPFTAGVRWGTLELALGNLSLGNFSSGRHPVLLAGA